MDRDDPRLGAGRAALRVAVIAALWIAVAVLVVLGIVGTFLPVLPGAPLVFAAVALAAWIDGFARISVLTVIVVAFLGLLALAADLAATALGARRFGAGNWGTGGAIVGLLVGLFFGIPGIILGPFAGAIGAEALFARKSLAEASRAGAGTLVGLLLGAVAKGFLTALMLGVGFLAYLV